MKLAIKYILIIFFIVLSTIIVLPLLWMIITSLKQSNELLLYPPTFIPQNFTFDNYLNLFEQTKFVVYLSNSLIVASSVTIITGIVATLAAYSLVRFNIKFNNVIKISALLGYMIAPIMIVIPFFLIMRVINLGNTTLSLILAHIAFCFPFSLWLMIAYIKDLPEQYEKAAYIDGANKFQTFCYVVIPNVLPGILAISIFTFILSWNDYVFARILITGDALKTIPIGIEDIYHSTVVDWGMLMASGVVISVPIIVGFIIIYQTLFKKSQSLGMKF